MTHTTRRSGRVARIAAIATVVAIALAGCAGPAADSSGEKLTLSKKPVTLDFTWWGNDTRQAITQKVISAFEEKHPSITVQPQFSDWSGYWDKLSTSVAAKDTPDIIQMDEKFVSTYASNGVLLDLGTLGKSLDLSDFSKASLSTGQVDGKQYAVPTSVNSTAMVVNKTLLDKYGIAMPDDTSWTWTDLEKWSATASATTKKDGVYATELWNADGVLHNWLRQNDDSLYNAAGKVSVKPKLLQEWWQTQVDLIDDGVGPAGDVTVEHLGGLSESLLGTNKALIGPWWSNQIQALEDSSGSDMVPLALPTVKGAPKDSSYLKTSMYWAASSQTKHPAEVALFLDFLDNDKSAADLLQTERGVPANAKIRSYITPTLDPVNTKVMGFVNRIEKIAGAPIPVPPPGGAAIETLLLAASQSVWFAKATPKEASTKLISDLQQAVDDAQ